MNAAIAVLADWLGVTERRQAEQDRRAAGATAKPGETWTAIVTTDQSVLWVSGPVSVVPVGRQGRVKMLGDHQLPDQARPLSAGTGLLASKSRMVLQTGSQQMPPRLPAASGMALQMVPAGVLVMVEYRSATNPGTRFVVSGKTGWILHNGGKVGRHIGGVWVLLDDVVGLIHDHGANLQALHHHQGIRRPGVGALQITADRSDLSVEGTR